MSKHSMLCSIIIAYDLIIVSDHFYNFDLLLGEKTDCVKSKDAGII
jgi:hypothetical protein